MNLKHSSLLILLTSLLVGCSPAPQLPYPSVAIDSPAVTKTPAGTATPAKTATGVVFFPSRSPMPTLPPDEGAFQIFLEYMSTNNGCDLPCWWGITPGESDWDQARPILNQSPLQEQGFRPLPLEVIPGQIVSVIFNVPAASWDLDENHSYYYQRYKISEGSSLIEMIWAPTTNESVSYGLGNVLEAYGVPDEIRIGDAFYRDEAQFHYISLQLLYSQKGIMFSYMEKIEFEDNFDALNVCFQSAPSLFLWNPNIEQDQREQDFDDLFPIRGTREFFAIEDVSPLDPAMFFEEFQGVDDRICMDMNFSN